MTAALTFIKIEKNNAKYTTPSSPTHTRLNTPKQPSRGGATEARLGSARLLVGLFLQLINSDRHAYLGVDSARGTRQVDSIE
jgi:hypothetical protein